MKHWLQDLAACAKRRGRTLPSFCPAARCHPVLVHLSRRMVSLRTTKRLGREIRLYPTQSDSRSTNFQTTRATMPSETDQCASALFVPMRFIGAFPCASDLLAANRTAFLRGSAHQNRTKMRNFNNAPI